jgi:hypothetical protein
MKCSDAEIRTNAANFFYATSAPGASGEMTVAVGRDDIIMTLPLFDPNQGMTS